MKYKWGEPDKYGDFPYLYSYKKEELNDILRERLPEDYSMQLVDPIEVEILASVVNQGIDSHLEACTMSEKFEVHDRKIGDRVVQQHLGGAFDKDGMICLIRRLMEFSPSPEMIEETEDFFEDDDLKEAYGDTREEKVSDRLHEIAYNFLSCILETLQIEYHGC